MTGNVTEFGRNRTICWSREAVAEVMNLPSPIVIRVVVIKGPDSARVVERGAEGMFIRHDKECREKSSVWLPLDHQTREAQLQMISRETRKHGLCQGEVKT